MTAYQKTMFDEENTIFVGDYYVKKIMYADTKPFILDIHYAKRMPSISYCLLYTSPSPRDRQKSRMPSSA